MKYNSLIKLYEITFAEIGYEIISTTILTHPLIQGRHVSVTGEIMRTKLVLVNRLGVKSAQEQWVTGLCAQKPVTSSWDDSHKRKFFTGTIHPGRFALMVKKWNKKFFNIEF